MTCAFPALVGILLASMAFFAPAHSAGSAQEFARLVEAVSGDQIMKTIQDLEGYGSRINNASTIVNAGSYIHDEFMALGLSVEYHDFLVGNHVSRNVVATLHGESARSPQYLFGAHYDSATTTMFQYADMADVPAPGADDDASGVAAVLELARVLHDEKLQSTVKFVAFAAEETGLNGSADFVVRERAAGTEYVGTAIMDMIGYRSSQVNRVNLYLNQAGDTFADATEEAIPMFDINLTATIVVDPNMTYSDHYPFWVADYPSMLVIEQMDSNTGMPANPYYHTAYDTSDHLSVEQMTEITKAMLGAMLILNEPLKEGTGLWLALAVIMIVASAIIVLMYIGRRRIRQ